MKKITFFLTEFCDKKCQYCDIPLIKKKKNSDIKNIKKYIPKIKQQINKNTEIRLTGGEIGFLSKETIDYLFNELENITINTNGFFLEKYPQYIEKCEKIYYHPSTFFSSETKLLDYENIIYQFPVINNKIDWVEDLLNTISDETKISLLIFDDKQNTKQKFQEEILNQLEELLWKKKFYEIDLFKNIQLNKKININLLRNICSQKSIDLSIDFVNLKIQQCVCSHTFSSSVDLTDENIENFNNLKFIRSEICGSCFHCLKLYDALIYQIKNKKNEKICFNT